MTIGILGSKYRTVLNNVQYFAFYAGHLLLKFRHSIDSMRRVLPVI